MQINIQARNFHLTKSIEAYIKRRLKFALNSRDQHIQSIAVRLSDINGPRGGADKRCKIQVVLPHIPDVVIQDTEVDLYLAIDRAVDRASTTIDRRLSRHRNKYRYANIPKKQISPHSWESSELIHQE